MRALTQSQGSTALLKHSRFLNLNMDSVCETVMHPLAPKVLKGQERALARSKLNLHYAHHIMQRLITSTPYPLFRFN